MDFLSGWKTYILALVGGAIWVLVQIGWIPPEQGTAILTPIGLLVVTALRQAIAKAVQTTQLQPSLVKEDVAAALAAGATVAPSGKP